MKTDESNPEDWYRWPMFGWGQWTGRYVAALKFLCSCPTGTRHPRPALSGKWKIFRALEARPVAAVYDRRPPEMLFNCFQLASKPDAHRPPLQFSKMILPRQRVEGREFCYFDLPDGRLSRSFAVKKKALTFVATVI